MPTVPYNPIPEAVGGQTLPSVRLNVDANAFGADVANAISHAGKTIAGVGDQIFERAIWLQNQNNAAEARKAEADYIIRSGNLHAEFNQLEGDAAVKAYPQYVQNLKALRESVKGSLSTGDAQRRFDDNSLGTLSRNVFNAAQHMASAQKQFIDNSLSAKRTAVIEDANRTPDDEVGRRRSMDTVRQINQEQGRLHGKPQAEIDNLNRTTDSKITSNWIEKQSDDYPMTGPELLKNQYEQGKISEPDYKRLKPLVEGRRDAYAASKVPQDYLKTHTDEEGNLSVSVEEAQADMRKMAEKMAPDDPQFANKLVKGFQNELYIYKQAKRDQKLGDVDVINGAILGGAKSMDELMMNPKAKAAWDRLPDQEKLRLYGAPERFIKKRDAEINDKMMTTIVGLKNGNVEEFLNLDPTDEKYHLSQAQIRQVMNMQEQVKKQGPNADPRVSRAMGWLRQSSGAQLVAMGLDRITPSNKTDYYHMQGAVQQALDIWQEQHKKPPTQQEFNEKIAPNIIKQSRQSWSEFFQSDASYFGLWPKTTSVHQHDTSSKAYRFFEQKAKEDVQAAEGREPTDEEIYKAYTRLQLMKLYPPSGGAKKSDRGGGGE